MNIFHTSILLIVVTSTLSVGCSKEKPGTTQNQIKEVKSTVDKTSGKNIYDISVTTMDGEEKKLSEYSGKVLMIVNVASKCGYTKQYAGLEEIYKKYSGEGFVVLGFPCNDFGGQEPGSNDEIRTFCETKFNVTFPLFDKIKVLGDDKSPLYARLTGNSETSGDIGWNFEKFIISKNGDIVARYKSKVEPTSDEITSIIETELKK
jgi:glutathione peroxidase